MTAWFFEAVAHRVISFVQAGRRYRTPSSYLKAILVGMKITFAISLEDYRAIQPAFVGRAGRNAGFKGVLVVCSLMSLLGVYCTIQGLGISTGAFLIGLSICSGGVAYLFDKKSVGKTKEKYETSLVAAYQRMHCHDHRTLDCDDAGFTVSCRCGTVTRPWSELAQFSENTSLFFVGTKTDGQIVPKSAFSSEGEITEFRAVFLEKLGGDVTSRHIDFSYTTEDFRHARILHVFEGGGWRRLAGSLATFAFSAFGVYVIWDYLSPHRNLAVLCGLTGALLGIPLLKARRKLRKHYFGPQRIYFGEQGLHLQNSGTLARNSWTQFIGYLENRHIFLLYYTPRTYRIIPRRALIGCEAAFRALLEVKVRRFNDKRPLPPPVGDPARH